MRHAPNQHGYTLIEVVLSIALLSIIMTMVGSAVLFATQVSGGDDQPSVSALQDMRAVQQISEDLSLAKYVPEQETHAVTVIVPDQTGDGQPDRLRYAWSGTPGDPLVFELNGSPQGQVLDSVKQFELQYTTTASTTVLTQRAAASGPEQQAYYTDPDQTVEPEDQKIDDKKCVGQLLSPELTGGHEMFQVSSVRIRARSDGETDGVITAELRLAQADDTPSDTVLGSTSLLESSMGTAFAWHDLDFSDSTAVETGTQVCLVLFKASGDKKACEVEYDKKSDYADSKFYYLYASDTDKPWEAQTGESLLIDVKVRPAELEPDKQFEREHLTRISLRLQRVGEARQPVYEQVRLIQAPAQLDAYWEAYYEAAPKQITIDADGALGFADGSVALPAGALEDAPWTIAKPMVDASTALYNDVITAEVRLRAVAGDGPMILLPVTVDSSGDILPVWVKVREDSPGDLELAIYSAWIPIVPNYSIDIPSSNWVDFKLTVLPEEELLMVTINNERKGTYTLNRRWNLGYEGSCDLYDLSDNVGYAHVRIGVGGTYSSAP